MSNISNMFTFALVLDPYMSACRLSR